MSKIILVASLNFTPTGESTQSFSKHLPPNKAYTLLAHTSNFAQANINCTYQNRKKEGWNNMRTQKRTQSVASGNGAFWKMIFNKNRVENTRLDLGNIGNDTLIKGVVNCFIGVGGTPQTVQIIAIQHEPDTSHD